MRHVQEHGDPEHGGNDLAKGPTVDVDSVDLTEFHQHVERNAKADRAEQDEGNGNDGSESPGLKTRTGVFNLAAATCHGIILLLLNPCTLLKSKPAVGRLLHVFLWGLPLG